jgi:hypothetical protein
MYLVTQEPRKYHWLALKIEMAHTGHSSVSRRSEMYNQMIPLCDPVGSTLAAWKFWFKISCILERQMRFPFPVTAKWLRQRVQVPTASAWRVEKPLQVLRLFGISLWWLIAAIYLELILIAMGTVVQSEKSLVKFMEQKCMIRPWAVSLENRLSRLEENTSTDQ